MKLLLTAFDPFGGEKINPALEAVKRVQDKIGDLEIVKLEVPTVFYKSIDTVENAIEKEDLQEIIDELKKLGINTPKELLEYVTQNSKDKIDRFIATQTRDTSGNLRSTVTPE